MADAQVAAKKPSRNKVLLYAVGLLSGAAVAQCMFIFIIKSDTAFHKEMAAVIPSPAPVAAPAALPAPLPAPVSPASPAEGQEETEPAEPAMPSFTLAGIFLASDGNYAIVDDSVVKKADQVKGCTVQDITQSEVTLECKTGNVTLSTRNSR